MKLEQLRNKINLKQNNVFKYIYKDYMVLLSVATCQQMWTLHEAARKEALVHLAITGTYKKVFLIKLRISLLFTC